MINNNDVQLFFANNEEGNIAIIYDLKEEDRNNLFTCPVCNSEVKPVCIDFKKKSGEYSKISPHFSHFDSSKCDAETRIHFWTKTKFLVIGDKFTIHSDITKEYTCAEVLIEKAYPVGEKTYIADITIITECGVTIFFELNYTNKKKVKDYLEIWEQLGNIVVEVDIKTLINVSREKNCIFEALYYNGKCFDKAKNNLYNQTIGKYKEKIDENTCSDETKKKLQNLNWFWREFVRYKKGEADIELLTSLIDYNDKEEKDVIFSILSRKTCVNMYEDYVNYKGKLFYKLMGDCLNTYGNGAYKEFFNIEKIKEGRKYKYIPYNRIRIATNYNVPNVILSFDFDLTLYSKEMLIAKVQDILESYKNIKPYYDESNSIRLLIVEKYKKSNGNLSVSFARDNDECLHRIHIQIGNFWYFCISKYLRIYKDKIKFEDNELAIDLLEDKDNKLAIDYISKIIDTIVEEYKQTMIEKEIKIQKEIEEEKERRLLEIEKETEVFKINAKRIAKIFDMNKDKIIDYQLDYILDDTYRNLLYFKDYRGISFIIYTSDDYIHNGNKQLCINKKKYSEFSFIEPNLYMSTALNENIFIIEKEKSYVIDTEINIPLQYKYQKYFDNKKINLSFRRYNDWVYLPRYDFIKATSNLNDVMKQIELFKKSEQDKINKKLTSEYKNNIIQFDKFNITNEDINKEINRILYPISYRYEKSNNDEVNLIFNVDFTRCRPWLIKDFIVALDKIGIKNVYNRI